MFNDLTASGKFLNLVGFTLFMGTAEPSQILGCMANPLKTPQ